VEILNNSLLKSASVPVLGMSSFYLFLIYGRSGGVTTHFAHHLVRANERFYKHKTENTSEGRNAEQKGYSWPRKDNSGGTTTGGGGKEG
jgi:hypothetical protein